MNGLLSMIISNKNGDWFLANRKKIRIAQYFAWLRGKNFLCECSHTKVYIELFCQNKCLTQSETKVLCELAILLSYNADGIISPEEMY